MYAVARFEKPIISVNNYNKLKVQIFSKVDELITISRIQLKLNELSLNQEVEGNQQLAKGKPITIEKELYLTNETANQREFILLNEIMMKVGEESSDRH